MSSSSLIITLCIPVIICLLHYIEKKFGSARAGWVASFPVLGAPAILMLSLEYGAEFGSKAAGSSLLGMIGWGVFILWFRFVSFGFLLKQTPWFIIFFSTFSWVLCAFAVLNIFDFPTLLIGIIIIVAIVLLALRLAPQNQADQGSKKQPMLSHRILLGTFFILLTYFSSYIGGATLSGLLTAFPVVSASLMVPALLGNHRFQVSTMSSGILTAGPALAVFMFSQQWLLTLTISVPGAFLLSLTIAVVVHLLMWKIISILSTSRQES